MDRARILLADDHAEMRDLVRRLLEQEFEVVDCVKDGLELLEAAAKLKPDLCLVDISMPIFNGIEAATRLKESGSTSMVVFLTIHEDLDFVQAALKTGASGYVVKGRMVSDLRPAIKAALEGGVYVSSCIPLGAATERDQ